MSMYDEVLTAVWEKDGQTYSLTYADWAQKTGLIASTIWQRIHVYGWDTDDAVNADPHSPVKYYYQGKYLSAAELSDLSGIPKDTLRHRLKKMPAADAIALGGVTELYDVLVNIDGVWQTFAEWAEANSIPLRTAYNRVTKHGMDVLDALTRPYRKKHSKNQ